MDLVQEFGLDRRVRLAIVDDDPDERERLLRGVRRSDLFEYDISFFDSFQQGLASIAKGGFHLALVDYDLGSANGFDFVRQARARSLDTPIVVMTDEPRRRMDFQVLLDGGADVVEKDDLLRSSILERIVRHTLLRTRQARELQRRASYDDLTGLANRTYFRSVLEHELWSADRTDGEVSVLYIDLDGFKTINDQFGHTTGDAVLRGVSDRFQDAVAGRGLVARLGGDEFAVVLPGGEPRARAVRWAIERLLEQPFGTGSRSIAVRASIGWATYPRDGQTADRLVDHADRMMYGAKHRAASHLGGHPRRQPERWWRRLQRLVDDFPRALQNDELHLVFQPQLDDVGGRVRSVEALTRWQHPSLGPVSPAEFIPAIERCDLAYELDSWVIRRALEARKTWASCGFPLPRMAVNVSARSLIKPSLLNMLNDGLTSTGQSPSDIEIELTETAVLDAKAAPVMRALTDNGVSLAIDDFGVGQSSLASLAQTPATVLKLDRTLLVGAALNDRHEKVLRWAIRLGRDLGMEVVAEGIEAQAQLDLLRQESVDGYQGYFLARPLPGDEWLKWFTNGLTAATVPPASLAGPS